jgi:nucleoside-diphosphate-sugar epimerase
MKRVLLTGATGFIGRHVLPHLVQAGYDVHPVAAREFDLLDGQVRREIVARIRPTHLVHLAWHVSPGEYWTSLRNIEWVQASLDLLVQFAANGGQRVVSAGTCAEYSWEPGGVCVEDQTPLAPSTLYGASKDALRRMQESLARQLGLSSAWGRIFFPYGPCEPPGRLVPAVIGALLAGQSAPCTRGCQRRDFMYIDDVARAVVVLLESGLTGAVNIGTGSAVRVADVVGTIGAVMDRLDLIQLGALPDRAGEPAMLVADTARLESIGFRPQWSLEQAIRATVRWWQDTGIS